MGFFGNKKRNTVTDFSLLKSDMHSHLLPGIDDGSPTMENSVRLVKSMIDLGFTKLITTPHIMWDMYKNTPEIILDRLEQLRAAVKAEGLDVEIQAGAEYFLDDYVAGLLHNNQPLLPFSRNRILVEFSLALPPMHLKEILFDMQMQGYQPVIAHPERYIYMERAREFYDELKDIGCLFQLNVLSLTNYYGKTPHELAQYLIKKGYYDLIGTDLHHLRQVEELNKPALFQQVQKLMESGKILNPDL